MFRLIVLLLLTGCIYNDDPKGKKPQTSDLHPEGEPLSVITLTEDDLKDLAESGELEQIRKAACDVDICYFQHEVQQDEKLNLSQSSDSERQISLVDLVNINFEVKGESKAELQEIDSITRAANLSQSWLTGSDILARLKNYQGDFDNDCQAVEVPYEVGTVVPGGMYESPVGSGTETKPTEVVVPNIKILSNLKINVFSHVVESYDEINGDMDTRISYVENEMTGSYLRNYTDFETIHSTMVSPQNSHKLSDEYEADDVNRLGLVTTERGAQIETYTHDWEPYFYESAEKGYSDCEDCFKPNQAICNETPVMTCEKAMELAGVVVTEGVQHEGTILGSDASWYQPAIVYPGNQEMRYMFEEFCEINVHHNGDQYVTPKKRLKLKPVSTYFPRYPSERFEIESNAQIDCREKFPEEYNRIGMTGEWLATSTEHWYVYEQGCLGLHCAGKRRRQSDTAEKALGLTDPEPFRNQCIDKYLGYEFSDLRNEQRVDCLAAPAYVAAKEAYEVNIQMGNIYYTYANFYRDIDNAEVDGKTLTWRGYYNESFEIVLTSEEASNSFSSSSPQPIGMVEAIGILSRAMDVQELKQMVEQTKIFTEDAIKRGESYVFDNEVGKIYKLDFLEQAILPTLENHVDVFLDAIDNPDPIIAPSSAEPSYEEFMEDAKNYWSQLTDEYKHDWGTREDVIENAALVTELIKKKKALTAVNMKELACNVAIKGKIRAYDKPVLDSVRLGNSRDVSIEFKFK